MTGKSNCLSCTFVKEVVFSSAFVFVSQQDYAKTSGQFSGEQLMNLDGKKSDNFMEPKFMTNVKFGADPDKIKNLDLVNLNAVS